MAGFITSAIEAQFAAAMIKHFETFSAYHTVTIHKEPKSVFVSPAQPVYAGYGNVKAQNNVSLIPVSESFRAMVVNKQVAEKEIDELNISLTDEQSLIKIEEVVKNYMENGKTIKVELEDGRVFNSSVLVTSRNYIGVRYYYYLLERTQ